MCVYTVHDVRVCKYVHAHVDLYEMPLGTNGEVLGYLNNYEQIGWCFLAGSPKKKQGHCPSYPLVNKQFAIENGHRNS